MLFWLGGVLLNPWNSDPRLDDSVIPITALDSLDPDDVTSYPPDVKHYLVLDFHQVITLNWSIGHW